VDLMNKRVLMRVDFNVPIDEKGMITDDTRIRETLPTIQHVLKDCSQLVIMTHFGRPKGPEDSIFRTNVLAERLIILIGQSVRKVDFCTGDLPQDKIIFLENVRFYPEEEQDDDMFAQELAKHGQIYVCEAFSNAHRKHASMHAIMKYLPCCAGMLFQKEVCNLSFGEERPLVAVVGGSKISTKFGVLNTLLQNVDYLLIGGAMMFTFYKAKGWEIGKSLYEKEQVTAAQMMQHNDKLILPVDVVVARDKDAPRGEVVDAKHIPADMIGLDIGPKSIALFKSYLKNARQVFWNGPLGYFENHVFAQSTNELAVFISALKARTVVGGGDTIAAIDQSLPFTHISTAGGASLELIEKGTLPAIKTLDENEIEFFGKH
ncbi:MAG: phosphoglycerate kinase, partial [archaeon]